ncbi:MAG TPA: hypothetical protein VNW06_11435 [Cytophagaceae bacterium]|jgi:hypothetical protein|nr:hypothetical protein [Cytophagaceae bacterium]
MKYLSLDNSEFRELLHLKRVTFIVYLVASIIFASISYLVLDKIIAGRAIISTLPIVLFLAGSSLIIFIYSNRDYFLDLIKKEKKVFKGVLSSKTARNKDGRNYYVFNMDGNGFVVDKETFNNCNEGDIVEFHTSPLSKYLFKVEKVSEAV